MKRLVVVSLILAVLAAQTPAAEVQSGIEGAITLSPAHGGPSRVGVPDTKPLANAEFVVENESGKVAEFTTDEAGRFRIFLSPGHYTVSFKNKKHAIGQFGPFDVQIAAGQTTKVEWNCDSGMR